MSITRITLRNFRCFKQAAFDFTTSNVTPGSTIPGVTIIQGSNGSGKTSLLEALHYGCYLRSFRTHVPSELCHDHAELAGFNVQITTTTDTISIGVSGKKRIIKLNGTPISTYNELIKIYKVVTFMEDDLECIKGYPETRRSLIDTALSVHEPHYHNLLRSLRKIVEQRTKIIQEPRFHEEQYQIWTEQLIEVSKEINRYRNDYLGRLSTKIAEINKLYDTQASESFLTINYREKRSINSPEDRKNLLNDELRSQRNLYGPHLDDIEFLVHERNSRSFASRGQQKLAVMILKIAQAHLLLSSNSQGNSIITFLIDDFLTDFDEMRVRKLLALLFELRVQLIITTPQPNPLLFFLCQKYGDFNLITIDSNDPEQIIPQLSQSARQEISG